MEQKIKYIYDYVLQMIEDDRFAQGANKVDFQRYEGRIGAECEIKDCIEKTVPKEIIGYEPVEDLRINLPLRKLDGEKLALVREFLQEAYDRAKHAYAYSNNQNFRAFSDGEACLAMEALRLIDKLNNNDCQN